jgi:hypothetical protein
MKILLFIITLLVVGALIYLYFHYTFPDMTYVKSDIDNNFYLVRNTEDKHKAANILGRISQDALKLSEHLEKNKNKDGFKEMKEYIELFSSKVHNIIFVESTSDSSYTSYSVNKGEQVVFCLRTKITGNELHDYNLVMYVVLHELTHVMDPFYDDHKEPFRTIFAFITNEAIKLGMYKKIDFGSKPETYCGMEITESIV